MFVRDVIGFGVVFYRHAVKGDGVVIRCRVRLRCVGENVGLVKGDFAVSGG
ncbi:hypothetical protein [Moraxella lacunata]|uniref:hypothetical protein n=1 Tax=Moraxella lacunata TaxID=477 RepID=UPI003EE14EB9